MKNDFEIEKELCDVMHEKNYSVRTERAYLSWAKRYIAFHQFSCRNDLKNGETKIEAFLIDLALHKKVSRSTQAQAKNALIFLYRHVLGLTIGQVDYGYRPAIKEKKPVVLSEVEIFEILTLLQGDSQLVAKLLYGCGLRILETVRLWVHDIDFKSKKIIVHNASRTGHRRTPLPISLFGPLQDQIARVKIIHRKDCSDGHSGADLPEDFVNKSETSSDEFCWQYLFPARKMCAISQTGDMRRQHIDPSLTNKAMRSAAKIAGINKKITPQTFRRSYARHLVARGMDVKKIQALLGHADTATTRNFTKVMQQNSHEYLSPLDCLSHGGE